MSTFANMPKLSAILTIDDAPSPDFGDVLQTLAEQGIKAIFFCSGEQIAERRGLLLQALHAGHWLGNHAWDHRHFSELSLEECLGQIEATELLLKSLRAEAGCTDHPLLFRFPYGDKGLDNGEKHTLQNTLRANGYKAPADLCVSVPNLEYPEAYILDEVDWFLGADSRDWNFQASNESTEGFAHSIFESLPSMVKESGCEILIFHDHLGNAQLTKVALSLLKDHFDFRMPAISCVPSNPA